MLATDQFLRVVCRVFGGPLIKESAQRVGPFRGGKVVLNDLSCKGVRLDDMSLGFASKLNCQIIWEIDGKSHGD